MQEAGINNRGYKDVETRKVQKLGSSSLFITLPKKWVNKWTIKPGDKIVIEMTDDGSLRLTAEKSKFTAGRKSIKIDLDALKEPLSYAIPCLYSLGYDEITITGKKLDLDSMSKEINDLSRFLIGLEVSESGENYIKLDCLLDSERLSAESLLRRLLNIISKKVEDIASFASNQQVDILSKDEIKKVIYMSLRRVLESNADSIKESIRNMIIAVNLTHIIHVDHVLDKLINYIKDQRDQKKEIKDINILKEILHNVSDLMDEIVMSLLLPSVKRINNGIKLISLINDAASKLNDSKLRDIIIDLSWSLNEALFISSCTLYFEESSVTGEKEE